MDGDVFHGTYCTQVTLSLAQSNARKTRRNFTIICNWMALSPILVFTWELRVDWSCPGEKSSKVGSAIVSNQDLDFRI